MKLSSKAHYGLRAMVELAQAYGGEPLALSTIAESEGLSLGYLEQLVLKLRKEGLVESTRGARGGYSLATLPCLVTVGSVVRALEGPIAPVACASEEANPSPCQHEAACSSRQAWQQLRDGIAQVLDSISLAHLCSPALPSGRGKIATKNDCHLCSLISLCPGGT